MDKKYKRTISIITGVLLITLSLFLIITLVGFHPNDTLYFNKDGKGDLHHFLGKQGSLFSGFMYHMMGRGSYFFALFLFFTGYFLLNRISTIKKIGLIMLSFSSVVASSGLLSIRYSELSYRGGGLFGNFIFKQVTRHLNYLWFFVIFGFMLIGTFFILFRFLLKRANLIGSGSRKGLEDEKDKVSEQDFSKAEVLKLSKIEEKDGKNLEIKIGKLPLLQKVYYEVNGIDSGLRKEREKSFDESVSSKPGKVDRDDRIPPTPRVNQYDYSQEQTSDSYEGILSNLSILKKSKIFNKRERERETLRKAKELEKTLLDFGIQARVMGITRGPVITRYELQPSPGVKLSKIVNLSDNIALSLSANGVRIEAPIPGRSAVGIEIPNEEREIVTLGDIIGEAEKDKELPIILGKGISGEVVVTDLTVMPHLLIAGATGSGKSVCINSLIVNLLFQKRPEDVRFIMIDPKMVELNMYNGIPHLLTEVVTEPKDASKVLRWVIYEMENRYHLLDQQYVRDLNGYNQKADRKLPYIVVIIDEFANLMATSQKEVEDAVVRLTAMSRAVGIHLIMATQRPSVDVITGLIKANFPCRVAFQVASKTDSRTILDYSGAEKLLGKGDMLFFPAGSVTMQRIQGAFISVEEILSIVAELKKMSPPEYNPDIYDLEQEEGYALDYNDPIFDDAVEIVLKTKRASASFLQRRLKIGYNRAARLIERMEEEGIIGPQRGSKPREIYVNRKD